LTIKVDEGLRPMESTIEVNDSKELEADEINNQG
jgi:hypothetical protein